ncbi:hypothetical protein V8F06_010381 [Rhypophila decipiens]
MGVRTTIPARRSYPIDLLQLPDDVLWNDELDADKQGFEIATTSWEVGAVASSARQDWTTHPVFPWTDLVVGIAKSHSILGKLICLWLLLFLAQLVCAAGPHVAYRVPKMVTLAISTLGSLGTGMTSLQFNDPDDPKGTQLAKIWLRIAGSACLLTLTVGYTLWFLNCPLKKQVFMEQYAQKKRSFLLGLGGCSMICWLFLKLASPATDEPFLWIDTLNLLGLLAVITGILNAESSLIGGGNHNNQVDDETRQLGEGRVRRESRGEDHVRTSDSNRDTLHQRQRHDEERRTNGLGGNENTAGNHENPVGGRQNDCDIPDDNPSQHDDRQDRTNPPRYETANFLVNILTFIYNIFG